MRYTFSGPSEAKDGRGEPTWTYLRRVQKKYIAWPNIGGMQINPCAIYPKLQSESRN